VTTAELLERLAWPKPDCRFSGFSFATGDAWEIQQIGSGGQIAKGSAMEVTPDTVFDLASVTKLYTATLAAKLHASGEIDLDSPLSNWSDVSGPLGAKTARSLLTHSSGLPPEWAEKGSRSATIESLLSQTPRLEQQGKLVYSCTGYSLFSVALEQRYGRKFDVLVSEHLLQPLGLKSTTFNPNPNQLSIADAKSPEEEFPFGLVHDPRARAMDGVSGNAGLFGTAADVFSFFSEVLTGKIGVVSDAARRELFTPTVTGEWQQSIGVRHQDVARLGERSKYFSHTGFTGTLVMVDPATSKVAVLLTNRLQCGTTREQMAVVYSSFANSF
jgi:CubicO group peptidase (beta-lactamase class C family)